MNIGQAIRFTRHLKGQTQQQVADGAGISVSYVSLLEQGQRTPHLEVLERIAAVLETPVVILVFLAMSAEEMKEISPDLHAALRLHVLDLLRFLGENHDRRNR